LRQVLKDRGPVGIGAKGGAHHFTSERSNVTAQGEHLASQFRNSFSDSSMASRVQTPAKR
jgi:hypothetical protein